MARVYGMLSFFVWGGKGKTGNSNNNTKGGKKSLPKGKSQSESSTDHLQIGELRAATELKAALNSATSFFMGILYTFPRLNPGFVSHQLARSSFFIT